MSKFVFLCLSLFLFSSCGIKSSRTFEGDSDNLSVFSDDYIECTFSPIISDNFPSAIIHLIFKSKSESETEIGNLSGKVKWQQKGQFIPCPFQLTSIKVGTFMDNEPGTDSSFKTISEMPGELINVSGKDNLHLFTMEFSDTPSSFIPKNVDKLLIELNIEIKEKGVIRKYTKTIELNAKFQHHFWFLRDC